MPIEKKTILTKLKFPSVQILVALMITICMYKLYELYRKTFDSFMIIKLISIFNSK